MTRETEQEIYEQVKSRLSLSGSLETDLVKIKGKELYLIGEEHKSLDAVEYVHRKLVPQIIDSPNSWIVLREGLHSFDNISESDRLESVPFNFYFSKLPKVLNIPGEDIVKGPLDKEVKNYLLRNSRLSEKDIDAWYFINFITMNQNLPDSEKERTLTEKFGKPREYLVELSTHAQSKGQIVLRSIHEGLLSSWNEFSGKKLEEVMNDNPKRDRFLVSVGIAHLPAFSNNYTYVG